MPIKTTQTATATLRVTLPKGITVCQQGHTGNEDAHLLISSTASDAFYAAYQIRAFCALVKEAGDQ